MKKRLLPLIICILLGYFQVNAQLVNVLFDKLNWNEDFTETDTAWRQASNQDEVFIIQSKEYVLQRLNKRSAAVVVYSGNRYFDAYRADATMILDKDNGKNAACGFVFSIQPNFQGAFVLEINSRGEYRILKYNGREFLPVNVSEEGISWKKSSAIKSNGQPNVLSIYSAYKQYDIYINNKFVESLEEISYKSGKFGFYLSPGSKAKVKGLRVYTRSSDSTTKFDDAEKQLLNDVIKILKDNITKISREKDSLQTVITKSGKVKINEQEYNKTREQNKKLIVDLANLNKKVAALEAEVKRLKRFKEDVQKSQQGEIILNLTELIEREREKNAELERQILELKKDLEALKNELDGMKGDEK